jgi:putative MATE family efflux protein
VSRSRRLSPLDRRILGLAVPAFGALAVEPLYVLVDTAIVGRIGTKQLAGVAVAAAVLSLVAAGSNFLTYGTTERIARHLGAGDIAGAADVAVQATWLALLAGAPTAVVVALVARPVCLLFGARGEVLDHAETYVRISAVGIPLMLFALAAQGVHRGASDYRTPLWILLASNVANLLVELVLVFGVDLGVAGSAWSTVLAQVAAAIAFAPHVRRRVAAATTYRPHRAGVAPLLHAGRHLVLRVVGILGCSPGRRTSLRASTPRRSPLTRSSPACSCSSPWSSMPWRSRPRRSSPTRGEGNGPTRHAGSPDVSVACRGTPASA